MTRSSEPKPGQAPKQPGSHDLVTPVPGFENRDFHLILGPGHRSLTAGGKKYQFGRVIFFENTCLCMLSAGHKVQKLI